MPKCYLFMGPSGSGKTTLAESCFTPDQKIISNTTRNMRPGERDGVDYYFISTEQFEDLIKAGKLAEYDCYDQHYYGIAKATIKKALKKGDCYDPITPQGFWNLFAQYGDQLVPVWLNISKQTVATRLKNRADEAEIKRRLAIYEKDQLELPRLRKLPQLIELDGEKSLPELIQQFKLKSGLYSSNPKN
ncbi:guanylate kinase [Enterococcus sp. CSURQ0835]|uniref:guanylate kinase n=1 Tax=Enterococcus sp. CSURQ0835 TaxID=2681394 RepID=UPI001357953C|nr:guanylate kinase [Enterococcus sp. CSURQ0835]